MRNACLALLVAAALGACGEAEPPKPAAPEPPKPVALAPKPVESLASAPPSAPAPSADELLLERVRKALRDTREVDGQGVSATVEGGVVSLFGTVPSGSERRKVERFVAGIDGVKSVVNKLVVVRGS